ncbi:zinc finger, CCHC-type containing protein [Tanacetum coccineum]
MQMSTNIVKLDHFDGGSFKRWQKKMQFFIATLKVAYVLTKPYLDESEDETLAASRERLKFKNDDFICRRHILNAMSDPLFDVYQNYSTAKELWNALEERYFTEDATKPDDDDEEEYFDCEDNEEYFNHENDEEFTFMYLDENNTPIPADKALKNKDIHPIFPLFDQNLLSHEERKQLLPINPQVNKVFVESDQVALSSTSAYDRIESVAMGPYYKVGCSNSDGRDAFVFLKKPVRSAVEGSSLKGNGEKKESLKAEIGSFRTRGCIRSMGPFYQNEQIIVASPDGMYEKTFYESIEYEALLGWMTNDWLDGTCEIGKKSPGQPLKPPKAAVLLLHLPSRGILVYRSDGVIVRLPESKKRKLGDKGIECIFLGYAQNSKAYRFIVVEPNDLISVNTIIESRDARFDENRFKTIPKAHEISNETVSTEIPITTKGNNDDSFSDHQQVKPRRSTRQRRQRTFGPDFEMYLVEGDRKGLIREYPIIYNLDEDPQTYSEAMKSHDSSFWKEAVNDEMDSIIGNNTWILVDLPPGSKAIKSKWIFKRKLRVDGSIEKFKARLVAKGFTQREGLDYFDTYAPVARTTTIRILIALASINKLIIHQMDVKTAFLNGELEEEVYMEQPEGFVIQGQENKVCKLIKSLYGLKQAPKQWHQKFDQVILSNGFRINESDKCVYSRFVNGKGVIICLYVDDMLIFGTDLEQVQMTKKLLSENFDMKDLGEADVILGIKILRKENRLMLTQSHYIEKILKRFDSFNCLPVSTPFEVGSKLTYNTARILAQNKYAKVIGSLMYAMTCTRPDIAYVVGRLSRHTSSPGKEHWDAVNRVFKYLKKTMDYGLEYSGDPSVLEGYTDASWITDQEDYASTSGWIFTLGGGAVSWGSKKHSCLTDSTMAAEFVALASCCKEAEWLRDLLINIPLWPKPMLMIVNLHYQERTIKCTMVSPGILDLDTDKSIS